MLKNGVDISENTRLEALIELKNVDFDGDDFKKDKKEIEEEKKLLLYKSKPVSMTKLICHLSGKLEIFLMIFGTLCTIFSGSYNALWGLTLGTTINELTNVVGIDKLPEEEYQNEINKIEDNVNNLIMNFILLGIVTLITNFFMLSLWGFSAMRQMRNLKVKYFQLILEQEQTFFDENNVFEFSTKVQNQLEHIENGLGDRFSQVILMASEIISGLIVGFITSWKLSLILCSSFPIIIISVLISDYYSEKLLVQTKELEEKTGGIAEELLYDLKTVSSFCNFDFELDRYNDLIDEMNKISQKRILIQSIAYGLLLIASFVSISIGVLITRTIIIDEEINYATGKPYNSGDITTVLISVLNVIYSISGLGPSIQIIQKSKIASSDYFILLSKEKKKPKIIKGIIPSREEFKGKIEFKNVSFIYPHDKTNKLVLDKLNMVIEPGQKVAIVGESGCGKTTTISLIERFYDIVSGEILIDDIDIKKYDLNSLRDLIGYVQQEPVLFNFSIKENLIFGRERKLEKMGDINVLISDACEEAHIKNFIENNVDRYNYVVGIKGSKLSGGQKQRIAIARAILMKPKILILDEATSALDNRSEKQVQKALDNIGKKNITTIVIAHRLSTIKNSDLILAMKNGKIIEQGTHKELLRMNGYYAGLVREQLAEDEIRKLDEKLRSESMSLNQSMSMSLMVDTFNDVDNEDTESVIMKESIINNEETKKIKIDRKKLWMLVSDSKCDLITGTIAGLIFGGICPFVGVILGETVDALASEDHEYVNTKGFKYAMIYLGIAAAAGITIFLKMWKLQKIGYNISVKFKKRIIEKYLELHMSYFDIDKNSPGALLTKLSTDSSEIDSLILDLVGGKLALFSTLLISFIIGMAYDWKITLILFVFVPLIIYGNIKREDYKDNGRESNKLMKIESGSILSESVINTKTINSFNYQTKVIKKYEDILDSEKNNYLKNSMMEGLWVGLGLSCYFFGFGIAIKCGYIFLRNRSIDFEDLVCCISNIVNSLDGLCDILRNMGNSEKAKLAYKSIFETLDTKVQISAFQRNNLLKISPNNIKGNIEFRDVTFSYPTKPEKIVIRNLSFVIKEGQKIGLVGLSGSGKSSIIQLIERFYDVNSGEILIDGINIKEYNLFELRKKIGLVSQEPLIFKRNIYDNILYGNLDANKDEVFEMAKNAGIYHLLMNDKYLESDNPLSGGEKQRVAIARAFLKDPVIILLDEATSAMDKETENNIMKNIEELLKDKTCINISHRLSSIVNSDVIFVLDLGQIVEKGTHDELIKLHGKYYTLHKYSRK